MSHCTYLQELSQLGAGRYYNSLSVNIWMAASGKLILTCMLQHDAFVANINIPSEFIPFKMLHGEKILAEDDMLEPLAQHGQVQLHLVCGTMSEYYLARVHIVGLKDIALRLQKCSLLIPKDNYTFGMVLPYLRARCSVIGHVCPVYHLLKHFFAFRFHHKVRRQKVLKFAKQESIFFNNSFVEVNCLDMFFIVNPAGKFNLSVEWEFDILRSPSQEQLRLLDKELAFYAIRSEQALTRSLRVIIEHGPEGACPSIV